MLTVNPARIETTRILQAKEREQSSMQLTTYTAPIGGWSTNTNLACQDLHSAVILENFWPTETGIVPRGGTIQRIKLPTAIQSLFQYNTGEKQQLFAATDNAIYEFTPVCPLAVPICPLVSGQKSGRYSFLEMQNDGGHFLSMVNGTDPLLLYDGTRWQQVTNQSSPHAIVNIDTSRLVHVWAYRNRQFFIEKNTMNAWYLGINSVSGKAIKLPLSGIFSQGGILLFGATWSSDSGAGMDDRCVFATNNGEIAIFSGDPIDGWGMCGVYDIGTPLGHRAIMSVGGDLIIATKSGLIPLSAAIKKDPGDLKVVSLSRNIEPDWRAAVAECKQNSVWRLIKWEERNVAFAVPICQAHVCSHCFIVNLSTGKWSKFTGWKINDLNILGDKLYYGDAQGNVFQADIGGMDAGNSIECRVCFAFDHLSSIGVLKKAHLVRGIFRYSIPFEPKFTVAANYQPHFAEIKKDSANGNAWNNLHWNEAIWSNGLPLNENSSNKCYPNIEYKIIDRWNSVNAHGYTLAVQLQVVSDGHKKLDCEMISVDLTYSVGDVVV